MSFWNNNNHLSKLFFRFGSPLFKTKVLYRLYRLSIIDFLDGSFQKVIKNGSHPKSQISARQILCFLFSCLTSLSLFQFVNFQKFVSYFFYTVYTETIYINHSSLDSLFFIFLIPKSTSITVSLYNIGYILSIKNL